MARIDFDLNNIDLIYDEDAIDKNLNKKLCSGYGQYHSPINKTKPQEYITITLSDIISMVKNPQSIDKEKAQWFIPSTLKSRVHKEQRDNGNFYALWADIDEIGDILFYEISQSIKAILPETFIICYTSRSATPERQKSRIIIPLKEAVSGVEFNILQIILNDKLQALGITPDRAAERYGQICYLPNKKDFYQYEIAGQQDQLFNHSLCWSGEIEQHKERLKIEAEEQKARQERARQQVQDRIDSGELNPVQAYKDAYPIETALSMYGYKRYGQKWLSPNSESGQAGVTVKDGKWISSHGSDANIGKAYKGGTWGDAFDLFVYYDCHNDIERAVVEAGNMFYIDGKTINKHNQIEYKKNEERILFEQHEKQQAKAAAPTPDELKAKAKAILDAQEPCSNFNIDMLPYEWKNYIEKATAETAADPLMIVQSMICSISAMIGKRVLMPNGVTFGNLYSNIWCCSISDSGTFKTTALNKGSRFARRKEKEIYQKILELEKAKTSQIGKLDKKQIAEIDSQINELSKDSPFLSTKATAAALYDELKTGQEGMIQSSELGGWLKKIGEDNQGDVRETLTELFDVPDFCTKRTKTDGKITVRLPFITINGVSTVEWIQRNLQTDDVSSGFFARFLLFYPPKNPNRPPALPVAFDPNPFNIACDSIYMTLEEIRNKPQPIIYTLSSESRKLYTAYYNALWDTIEHEQEQMKRTLEPFLKRWTPYILKIAMLAQPFIDRYSSEISSEALEVAKYIVEYAIKSTTYLFSNQLGESVHQMQCRKVLEWIAMRVEKDKTHKWKDLLCSKVLTGSSKDYDAVIETLFNSGKISFTNEHTKKEKTLLIM